MVRSLIGIDNRLNCEHCVVSRGASERRSKKLSATLLAWYDRHRRAMPWRALPGETPDPYSVWLSEIMLQQTTVATVGPYFEKFVARWPKIENLAAANLDDVLHAWAGLGYYARARNLHKCAKIIALEHGGRFPDTEIELRKLPGIGPYTAAAVAAIAFGRTATVVDGNVERVIARLFAVKDPLPSSKVRLKKLAKKLTPDVRCGDYAQAIMDLGATVCSPSNPACGICPWRKACDGHLLGCAAELPKKSPKKERPTRYGTAFWLIAKDDCVLLRRRPEAGLLGGMMEIPSSEWRDSAWPNGETDGAPLIDANWQIVRGEVRHTFTHFTLKLRVMAARVEGKPNLGGVWCPPERFSDYALPTLMRKVVRLGLGFVPPR